MRRALLLLSLLFAFVCCFSQTAEVEPNNTFNTANAFLLDDQMTGDFAGIDTADYYRLNFNYNGNFQLHVQVTNTGATTQVFRFNTYNSLTISGQFVGGMDFRQVSLAPGNSYDGTIVVCGLAPDNLYVELKSAGDFEYTIEWSPGNAAPQDGVNNNTFATATAFTLNALKEGGVRYKFWGNSGFDSVDYFKSILPAANYTNIFLTIHAQNNDCTGPPNWIRYFLYKNGSTTPFTSGFVGNNGAVLPFGQVQSQIPMNTMQQGDELVIKFASNAAFKYDFVVGVPDPFADNEDNCCINNAILLTEGQAVSGNVGDYDYNAEQFIDEFDTYRVVLPHDGSLKLWVTATNTECDDEEYYLEADILNQAGSSFGTWSLVEWFDDPSCNETKSDSLKISMTAGTYYLRLHTDQSEFFGKIKYTIRYALMDSTGNIDVESNNTTATAIPVNQGEVKRGHVGFLSNTSVDIRDYYKTTFPVDGTVRVYMKTTSRSDNNILSIRFNSGDFSGLVTANPPGNVFHRDSVYIDTFNICGTAGGEIFFELTSTTGPFEYEYWYEVTDTSTTDNDIEPNNSFAQARLTGASALKKGHIRYVNGATSDDFDYYKFVYHTTDSLKLYFQATNTSCVNNRTITFTLYNKNQVIVFGKTKTNVGLGQTVTDSIKINVPVTTSPDSFYLRVDANEAFKYQLTTNPRLPSSTFFITGDTAVCVTTQVYKVARLADETVTYHWSLPDGGGTISAVDSVATVTWATTGNRRIQLFLSNNVGNSQTKQRTVIINGFPPTQVPVAYNFARTLSTNSLPPGTNAQWYRNDTLISGATSISYYASASGSYTVKFVNDCGTGPVSNAISFEAAAQLQTITFPHADTIAMSPTAKVVMAATASSGLGVFYQKISGAGTILNDTLFITGNSAVGTIIVRAMQPGDDVYSPAPDKYDSIVVIKGDQVINFDSIPGQILDANKVQLTATSTAGTSITYSIVMGTTLASVNNDNDKLTKKGAGIVTVRAVHNGNANYNPAIPVDRTFCIGVRTLPPILGDNNPCLNTYTYTTQKIPGANFAWTLNGGGILTTHNDTAWVQWQTPGSYLLTVRANSPCDTVYTAIRELLIVTSNNLPTAVSNMLPADNSVDQQLPLTLSWLPGSNTVNYDLYVWDSATVEPTTPYATNIDDIRYTLPLNAPLPHNRIYKWKVVARNPCAQTAGPVQKFKLIPLPDLVVSDVQAPAAVTSGQTITVSWKVTNAGPGNILPNESWYDGVYLSHDTTPNFHYPPLYNPYSWPNFVTNIYPLLLAKKIRPTTLDSGQSYTNSITYTLPLEHSLPVYVYVVTENAHISHWVLQVSVANDTGHKQTPMNITPVPTPDLRVDSVFATGSSFSGNSINLTYKVKNYGVPTSGSSSWRDSIFISQNPLFDRNSAIPLFLPKANGSYYPSAIAATVFNDSLQVLTDSSYTRNLQVVIPNFIFGTWFIYIKTNASATSPKVYEGAFGDNNLNQAQIQVYLTPTPKLTISSLSVPVTSASTTQTIGVNWNITNEGFRDNKENNKGHYLYKMIGHCPCNVTGLPPGSVCIGPPNYFDSLAQGSSYWLDKVYLSKDSTGLNPANAILLSEVAHGTEFSALQYADYLTGLCGYSGAVNVSNAIYPGSSFPKSLGFKVPSDLAAGIYYIYIHTNATKTVFEYPGTPQIKRTALPIIIQRPDVTVPSVSVPATTTGATTVTINYNVTNNGPGAVFSHVRHDRLYISNFPSFEGSAQLVGTKIITESLPVGPPVSNSFTYNMPGSATGAKYFYVITNYDSSFKEMDYVNNLSGAAMTTVSAAVPADLVVSSITQADSLFTIFTSVFGYTVTNNGSGATFGSWTDSVFISCSPVFNPATSYFIGRKVHGDSIITGESYSDTIHVQMPYSYEISSCFPEQMYSNVYYYVKTNANNQTYEGANINNNISGSDSRVLVNPLVDHIVMNVSAPDTTMVGFNYPVSWRIKNIGYNPDKIPYYYSWYDAIYFSADSIPDPADIQAAKYLKYYQFERNEEKADSRSFYTPVMPTGDYYVYVTTNPTDRIEAEKILTNNSNFIRNTSGQPKKIHVIQPALADLTDTIISAPVSVASGQPITVIYKIKNNGTGLTYPGNSYQTSIRLSRDFIAVNNDGDWLIATLTRTSPLPAGEFYYDTVTATVPSATAPGNYILISKANSNNAVVESNLTNNLGFSLLDVFEPPQTDLVVANIIKPDTVYLGYTIDTVKWVVTNTSAEEARGSTKDGIYLSGGEFLDSTATLIGIKSKSILLGPLQSDTVKMAPLVKGITEGNYNVFVKTDLLGNINESDDNNNTGMSSGSIYVKARKLSLNVPELNTLHTTERYYKMEIPDSLYGSTILVTLKTNDSLTMRNEIYIGGGYVPSAAHHDYMFEIPNSGNQQIVMASVTQPVYYIMYRCVSNNPPIQNITLKAVKLPFAILDVHTNSGANIGNVTVKIKGSLFNDSMVAKLSNGGATIYSSVVYFTNSTQVFATFNLQGRPLGVYDVTLIKADSSIAALINGFSIVPPNNGGLITGGINTGAGDGNEPGCDPGASGGMNSQLSVELVVPSSALIRRPVILQVNYSNPTNYDVPAQSRFLYSEAGMKMAFTREGVPDGTTSLYLELAEPGGPPGIIRAGASGSILIYSVAPNQPPPAGHVLFKLK